MVSFSKFNLPKLQIVALCSQTVAGFRAKPKLLQTVHKLLQATDSTAPTSAPVQSVSNGCKNLLQTGWG